MFPLNIAVKLPVHITHNVKYRYTLRNHIQFVEGALHFGSLRIGFLDRQYTYDRPSFIKIKGQLIIKGDGFHSFAGGTTLEIGENAVCEIGNNFTASHNNRIRIVESLKIGDDNMWSYDNIIIDNDGHQILNREGIEYNKNKEIVFGNNVWLGCRNIVLKGANIGNNIIVAPGSIINKEYTENNTIISSSGKILKRDIFWSRTLV